MLREQTVPLRRKSSWPLQGPQMFVVFFNPHEIVGCFFLFFLIEWNCVGWKVEGYPAQIAAVSVDWPLRMFSIRTEKTAPLQSHYSVLLSSDLKKKTNKKNMYRLYSVTYLMWYFMCSCKSLSMDHIWTWCSVTAWSLNGQLQLTSWLLQQLPDLKDNASPLARIQPVTSRENIQDVFF